MGIIKRILKSQEGAALILVLFLVSIMAISISAYLLISFYSSEKSIYGERRLDAALRSKGGIEEGLGYIDKTFKQTGTLNNHTINRDEDYWYNVEITASGNNFTISSMARYMTLDGTKEVIYVVNGNFTSGYGGLNSTFYNNSIVTVNPFRANNFNNINIYGDIAGDYNINNYNSFIIDGNSSPALTVKDFNDEYNRLMSQANTHYPMPQILSGTERISSSKIYNGDLERDRVIFNNGTGVIVFNGNVFTNELTIGNGDYDIVVEGTVRVKKLSISNVQGSIYFKGNVIVEENFNFTNANMDFTVNGIILTKDYKYNNVAVNYSVPYIIAKEKIDINNLHDINLGGLASPDISIVNVHNVNINQASGGNLTGSSYAITDWNVQY